MDQGNEHKSDSVVEHSPRPRRSFADRFLIPIAIPVGAALLIGAVMLAVSQILLAVPSDVSTPIALFIALFVLLACAFLASKPDVKRPTIYAAVAVPFLVLFSAGIASGIYCQTNGEKSESGVEASAGGAGLSPLPLSETTTDNKFSATSFTIAAGKQTTLDLKNDGQAVHNWHLLD